MAPALLALPALLGALLGLGPLFLLAGLLSAASLSRKGTGRFAAGRLVRLGLPLLLFLMLLDPLTDYLGSLAEGGAPQAVVLPDRSDGDEGCGAVVVRGGAAPAEPRLTRGCGGCVQLVPMWRLVAAFVLALTTLGWPAATGVASAATLQAVERLEGDSTATASSTWRSASRSRMWRRRRTPAR